jgi:hypothetical protein
MGADWAETRCGLAQLRPDHVYLSRAGGGQARGRELEGTGRSGKSDRRALAKSSYSAVATTQALAQVGRAASSA